MWGIQGMLWGLSAFPLRMWPLTLGYGQTPYHGWSSFWQPHCASLDSWFDSTFLFFSHPTPLCCFYLIQFQFSVFISCSSIVQNVSRGKTVTVLFLPHILGSALGSEAFHCPNRPPWLERNICWAAHRLHLSQKKTCSFLPHSLNKICAAFSTFIAELPALSMSTHGNEPLPRAEPSWIHHWSPEAAAALGLHSQL